MGAVAGLILAGGRGLRLGGVLKAGLVVNGHRLLDRAIDQAGPEISSLFISIGGHEPEDFSRWSSHALVPDLEPGFPGPIGGLSGALAALEGSEATHLLTLPVDTPFLPTDFSRRMIASQDFGLPVAMACAQGHLQPAHALWDVTALRARLAATGAVSRQLGPRQLFERGETHSVEFPASADGYGFAGINTVSDLLAAHCSRQKGARRPFQVTGN